MPYQILQVSPRRYSVVNSDTGATPSLGPSAREVHAKRSTLKNAKAQMRLLDSLEGGAITGKELKRLTDASYKKNKEKPEKIGDLVLDKELSTRKAAVYYNPTTGEATVTHRGTTSTASDWANNLALGVGLYKKTDRFKKGKETQKAVNAKYGKENVLTTGHSQSGALVHELNKEGLVEKSVEVNPARLPGQKVLKNETIVKSSFDPVSVFVPESKRVKVIEAKTYNPLAEHSAKIIRGEDAAALYGGAYEAYGSGEALAIPRRFM